MGLVAAKTTHLFAGLHVPEPDGSVPAAGDGQPAVRREGRAHDTFIVAAEAAQLAPVVQVPQAHAVAVVESSCEGVAAVRRTSHAYNRVFMSGKFAQQLAGLNLPQTQGPIKTGGQGAAAIGSEDDSPHRIRMRAER